MVTTAITVVLACDYSLQFSITNVAGTVAINLTGMNLSFMLKKLLTQPDSAVLIPEKTVLNNGIVVSGTYNATPSLNAQIATVLLHASDTLNLKPGDVFYELKCMDFPETVFSNGTATLQQGVHRT